MEARVPKAQAEIVGAPIATAFAEPTVDNELREWKRTRKSRFRMPWRPLSLMASLCFGIASLALPDWVNSAVQWPLFALAAASLYVGLATRGNAKI